MSTIKRTLVALAITAPLLSGCTVGSPSAQGDSDVHDIITFMDGVEEIHAKKKPIQFNDHWTITADGNEIGYVVGEPLHLVGDTYSFYTPNGHFVGAMEENWNVVNRDSDILNQEKEPVAYLAKDVIRIMQEVRLYDRDDTEVGKVQQNLNLGLRADIKDDDGNVEWKVRRDLISLGASVTLDRENQDDVSAVNALFMALMLNEIYEAESSE